MIPSAMTRSSLSIIELDVCVYGLLVELIGLPQRVELIVRHIRHLATFMSRLRDRK